MATLTLSELVETLKPFMARAAGDVVTANLEGYANADYVVLSAQAGLTYERVLTAGNGMTLTDAGAGSALTVATVLGKVLLYHAGLISAFAADDTGLAAANAAVVSGDMVFVPPGVYSSAITLTAGVTFYGAGMASVFSGVITLSANSDLREVYSSGGIVGNASGSAYIKGCHVDNGSGYGLEIKAGDIYSSDSYLYGTVGVYFFGIGALYDLHNKLDGSILAIDGLNNFAVVGDALATGEIGVRNEDGEIVSPIVAGNLYALEAFDGPWSSGVGNSTEMAYFNGGVKFGGALHADNTTVAPYTRFYFRAVTDIVTARVNDAAGHFGDNGGSLSWRLYAATVSFNLISSGTNFGAVPEGVIPAHSAQGAYDMAYATRHASDIYTGKFAHHVPLGNAEGDVVVWDGERWVAMSLADAGMPYVEKVPAGTPMGLLLALTRAVDEYYMAAVCEDGTTRRVRIV